MPEIVYETKDAVPEDLRDHAKETGGKFVVNVVARAKLDEFRQNNIELQNEKKGLTERMQRYAGVIGDDFDKFSSELNELRDLRKKVDTKALIDNSSFEAALNQRVSEMRSDYEGKSKAMEAQALEWKQKALEYDTRLRRNEVERVVRDTLLDPKIGARPEAMIDITERAHRVFRMTDKGDIVPLDSNGDVIYGADGTKPMTVSEWAGKLRAEASYFFKESEGGGAAGAGRVMQGALVRTKADLKDAKSKSAYIAQFGLEAFQNLPTGERKSA